MGKQTIASKALAIAKKQEKERLEEISQEFLQFMQEQFNQMLKEVREWRAIGKIAYGYSKEDINMKYEEIEQVAPKLGFWIQKPKDSNFVVNISIPEYVKGTKRTVAQSMLYHFNKELKKRIVEQKRIARQLCQEAIGKIEAGQFETKKVCDTYRITVNIEHEINNTLKAEICRIMERKHFQGLNFYEGKKWTLELKDR